MHGASKKSPTFPVVASVAKSNTRNNTCGNEEAQWVGFHKSRMPSDNIASWLARKRIKDFFVSSVCCLIGLLAGAALLVLMFSVMNTLVMMVLLEIVNNAGIAWISSMLMTTAIMALLVYDSFSSGRDDMGNIPLWMFRECCSFGPRLVQDSIRHFQRALNLARLDIASCAVALSRLAEHGRSITLDELLQLCPGMNRKRLREQLGLIEGVLFLRHDFSRVLLAEPLRMVLTPLLRSQHRPAADPEPEPGPTPVHEPEKLSAHEILGVAADATVAEVKTAYRNRIKDCHPDRFANMDQTSRERAEEWSKALNAAYATMVAGLKR